MSAVTITARLVSADCKEGIFPCDAGGSGNLGDLVYLAADGDVEAADGSDAGTAAAIGVVVAIGTMGAIAFVAGDRLSVCRYGPVEGFSGATPGSLGYVSDTTGKVDTAAGSTSRIVGRFDSATCLFVNPPA